MAGRLAIALSAGCKLNAHRAREERIVSKALGCKRIRGGRDCDGVAQRVCEGHAVLHIEVEWDRGGLRAVGR